MSFWSRKQQRVAVLGCGPAGLFAAHALNQNGYAVTIYSRKRRSDLYGAQYLHAPIPGLTDGLAPITVDYQLTGTPDGYRRKVYGEDAVSVSVETLEKEHEAWDIRVAYDRAWSLYNNDIVDFAINASVLGVIDRNRLGEMSVMGIPVENFDLIVNSIPLRSLCYAPDHHRFVTKEIWAAGDAPDRGIFSPISAPANTIVCDGTTDRGWYRISNVFGHNTAEWPIAKKPPLSHLVTVEKPVYTTCICYIRGYPVPFINVGRYGKWTKGVLSHHAYQEAAAL